jgi:hypothetical protein
MNTRTPHLQDDTIFDCYYAARRGETLDPPSADHLADCGACASRYSEVGAFLNSLGEEAEAEVSALFPPERLHAQQADIAKRLELVGRAARIISFPGRAAAPAHGVGASPMSPKASVTRTAARWIAVAAAAGLFIGVAAGSAFHYGSPVNVSRDGRRAGVATVGRLGLASAPSRLSTTAADEAVKAVVDMDDMFMSDLESALDRPHTSELVAFDALTPHLRDVRDFAR